MLSKGGVFVFVVDCLYKMVWCRLMRNKILPRTCSEVLETRPTRSMVGSRENPQSAETCLLGSVDREFSRSHPGICPVR